MKDKDLDRLKFRSHFHKIFSLPRCYLEQGMKIEDRAFNVLFIDENFLMEAVVALVKWAIFKRNEICVVVLC